MNTLDPLPESTASSADETWITIPEAVRLRGVREQKFYMAIKYGHLPARRVAYKLDRFPAQAGGRSDGFGWRWEVKLSDVMAMTFAPKKHHGAGGVYSGPPTERTLDQLMEAIEASRERIGQRRNAVFVAPPQPEKEPA